MKNLITFSLWGDNLKYCQGAIRNAELAPLIYPGWVCRFYIGSSVPFSIVESLTQVNKHWIRKTRVDNKWTGICGGGYAEPELEIYHMEDPGDWRGMFWRFEPASEPDINTFLSRDCDSRLTKREAAAVAEWMDTPQLIHVMRDHPYHTTPILGGLWGAKRHAIPNMKELIDKWNKEDRWQTDQEFLRDVIWPQYHHKVFAHDDWKRFPQAMTSTFPTQRNGNDFVGSIIGPNEERLHPEHHRMIL